MCQNEAIDRVKDQSSFDQMMVNWSSVKTSKGRSTKVGEEETASVHQGHADVPADNKCY